MSKMFEAVEDTSLANFPWLCSLVDPGPISASCYKFVSRNDALYVI